MRGKRKYRRKDRPVLTPVTESSPWWVGPGPPPAAITIPDYARNADGSVDPEAEAAMTLLAAEDRRAWGAKRDEWSRRGHEGEVARIEEVREQLAQNPAHRDHFMELLELSGALGTVELWGPVFEQISASSSPGMALYCLHVVLGWPEPEAYRAIYPTKDDRLLTVPRRWSQAARPYITALLSRFMPSRTRLLMHMEDLLSSKTVDASVRSNMMQFLARYLLEEVRTDGQALLPGSRGTGAVGDFIQSAIMRRGGVLIIPSEPEVLEQAP